MGAIKVTKNYFKGLKNSTGPHGLGAIIMGLSRDVARLKIDAMGGFNDFTDNSTGTAAATLTALVIPSSAYDATSAGGAQRAAFNTAIGKFENAGAVIAQTINEARGRLGLPAIAAASGTIAAANTIPAQDLTVATATGTSALDYKEGRAAMVKAASNLKKIVKGVNEVLFAVGALTLTDPNSTVETDGDYATLVSIADAAASATGASSISATVANTFLTTLGNSLATVAAVWNAWNFASITNLTDSSTGTASTTYTLVANPAPAAAAGAATTSAPKAGFDTQLAVIEANQADLASKLNEFAAYAGITKLVNSTAVSPDNTLAAMSSNLTAVDGSSGTSALDEATARVRMALVNDNYATLAAKYNEIAAFYGTPLVTDSSGGEASEDEEIVNIAATGTGVGDTAAVTMLDSAVDTWLGNSKNAVATLAAGITALNEFGHQYLNDGVVASEHE